MHDYALPTSGGITHVRPGVVGVPMTGGAQSDVAHSHSITAAQSRSAPMPVPVASRDAYRDSQDANAYSFVSTSGASASEAWSSPVSVGFAQSSFRSSSVTSHSASFSSGERSGWLGGVRGRGGVDGARMYIETKYILFANKDWPACGFHLRARERKRWASAFAAVGAVAVQDKRASRPAGGLVLCADCALRGRSRLQSIYACGEISRMD